MSYAAEWSAVPVALGTLLVLPLVPSFALIGLALVALAAVAALVALAGAILATPYLLARTLRRRLAERHQSRHTEIATFRAELSGPQVG